MTEPPLKFADNRADEIVADIRSRRHDHVLLLIGSIVSCSEQSRCWSVADVQRRLVLEPIARALPETADHILRIGNDIGGIPFEQMLGCVHAADPRLAIEIVRTACGAPISASPNANHRIIVDIAEALLANGFARCVTIATTNYDLMLDMTHQLSDRKVVWCDEIKLIEFPAGAGRLRYLKLHGCITRPDSCVFTMRRLLKSSLDPRHTQFVAELICNPTAPSLCIAIGYSFSDPDLHPVWRSVVKRGNTIVYWNSINSDADSDAVSGHKTLRKEFLKSLAPRSHHSDLFAPLTDENPNILAYLSRVLGLSERVLPQWFRPDLKEAEPVYDQWRARKPDIVAEVLARISDSYSQCAASDVLSQFLGAGPVRPALARLSLEAHAHKHDIATQLRESRSLANRNRGTATEVVSRAIESFAATIQSSGTIREQAKSFCRAVWTLLRPAWQLPFRRLDVGVFWWHYWSHLWAKAIQKLSVSLPPSIAARGGLCTARAVAVICGALLALVAQRHRRLLARTSNIASPVVDGRDVAGTYLLAGQTFLVASRPLSAKRMLETAESIYSAVGWLNGCIQADRAESTMHAIQGDRETGMRVLVRGLRRVVDSEDTSLKWKLLADWIRLAWPTIADTAKRATAETRGLNTAEVKHSLMVLTTGVHSTDTDGAVNSIVSWVRNMCDDAGWRRLLDDAAAFQDYQRYPLYFPSSPICAQVGSDANHRQALASIRRPTLSPPSEYDHL